MSLVQYKRPSRWVGLCLVLTLAIGFAYRSHAQTRVIGAPHLPAKTIEALQNNHGYFKRQWRRWPGTATAKPKKTSPENIPVPRPTPPKKEEVQPTPPALDRNPPFPLDRFNDEAPGQLPKTRLFPSGKGGLPSEGATPFDLHLDNAPKPPDSLKQPESPPLETFPPLNNRKEETVPFGETPLVPFGGAALSPGNRYYQAQRTATTRSSRADRQSYPRRYQPGRDRAPDPAARQRSRIDSPAYRRDPQGRYDNPLRSGTRTAVSPTSQRAVPVAHWSASDGRNVHRAESIRGGAPPRFNPLRP